MRRALIIVDHGSRLAQANALLEAMVSMLRTMTPDAVYAAHMELAQPTISQAFEAAVTRGADFVFVFPYFLAPGRHSREDIPRMCAEAAAKYPGLQWHCAGPIGLDRTIGELILRRMQQCEGNSYRCETCPDVNVCGRGENGHA